MDRSAGRFSPVSAISRVVKRLASHPLEILAIAVLIASSCYFALVHASFQTPELASLVEPRVSISAGHYLPVDPAAPFQPERVLLLKHFAITLPPHTQSPPQGVLAKSVLHSALKFQQALESLAVLNLHGTRYTWGDLCFRASAKSACFVSSPLSIWKNNATLLEADNDVAASIYNYVKSLDSTASVHATLANLVLAEDSSASSLPKVSLSSSSLTISLLFDVTDHQSSQLVRLWEQKAAQLRPAGLYIHTKVQSWAWSDAVAKFTEYFETSTNSDHLILFISFLLMHATFVTMFMNMRKLGSTFSLGFSVLLNGTFALLLALVVTRAVGINLGMVQLLEALPFLVISIGFEKPYTLAKAIMESSALDPSAPIGDRVWNGIAKVAPSLLTDYAMEIGVLALGSVSGIGGGMSEFCLVACWIIFFDGMFMMTAFVAVLILKLELNRIRASGNGGDSAKGLSFGSLVADAFEFSSSSDPAAPPKKAKGNDSFLSRFKLICILAVLVGHTLNASSVQTDALTAPAVADLANPATASVLNTISTELIQDQVSTMIKVAAPTVAYPLRYSTEELDGTQASIFEQLSSGFQEGRIFGTVALGICVLIAVFSIARPEEQLTITPGTAPEAAPESPKSQDGAAKTTVEPVSKKEAVAAVEPLKLVYTTSNDVRTIDECQEVLKSEGSRALNDIEVLALVKAGKIAPYNLEKVLSDRYPTDEKNTDYIRAVHIRRMLIGESINFDIVSSKLPFEHYDYGKVLGQCCENVIGYVPIPIGVAGPVLIDGVSTQIPMATTEGCLIASTSRGCKVLNMAGGVHTVLTGDGMTRGPVIQFPTAGDANECRVWIEQGPGGDLLEKAFNSTSRFARLNSIKVALAGRLMFIRFSAVTGDAMGMNMISKGVEKALTELKERFPAMRVVAVSGNYCTDKKPAAINWIEGRGKSVVADVTIPGSVIQKVFKTTVNDLVQTNIAKNLVGSAMAGSVGGFNAHAANNLTAIYLATGQDPAQNVESSQCLTFMEAVNDNQDLYVSCTMPCIEVGTVGGGTKLDAQESCLKMLGVAGANQETPGANAQRLARIIAAGVLAGELSLMAALVTGTLVQSHMVHNRAGGAQQAAKPAAPVSSSNGSAAAGAAEKAPEVVVGSCIKS
ncbi:hydroxymethylglutaryl-coenzyme A reductase-domain-containing protein [Polychytrium aggregatum]|uniref:hydroxymethylglutaryl-coenzyme A reductase-domain-containing protein n=1 Tax=Polychytrium aggregatum TaxID=110093 RepID=UPI0022FE3D9E|nr:hydroxymethylglutaryl-coenzyme A reductase-domain-containing protein [Polychytrium aggregatum]KAI9204976.1 hydroxymethylglutaryl-coenzyme A reductase-domain-containing protein [Polychytrium aggregatum]